MGGERGGGAMSLCKRRGLAIGDITMGPCRLQPLSGGLVDTLASIVCAGDTGARVMQHPGSFG